ALAHPPGPPEYQHTTTNQGSGLGRVQQLVRPLARLAHSPPDTCPAGGRLPDAELRNAPPDFQQKRLPRIPRSIWWPHHPDRGKQLPDSGGHLGSQLSVAHQPGVGNEILINVLPKLLQGIGPWLAPNTPAIFAPDPLGPRGCVRQRLLVGPCNLRRLGIG